MPGDDSSICYISLALNFHVHGYTCTPQIFKVEVL